MLKTKVCTQQSITLRYLASVGFQTKDANVPVHGKVRLARCSKSFVLSLIPALECYTHSANGITVRAKLS